MSFNGRTSACGAENKGSIPFIATVFLALAVVVGVSACSPLDAALYFGGELIRMTDGCNDASCDGDEIPDE